MIEKIQEHEYEDVYRIKHGVLLKVKKYRVIKGWGYARLPKQYLKKLKGLKNLYVVTNDWIHEFWPASKGDIIYGDTIIEPVKHSFYYQYEIKTTGAEFSGGTEDMINWINAIKEIVEA